MDDLTKWFVRASAGFLLLCGLSLALVAVKLGPVSKWASYQSICVEEIGKSYPIEYAVRKCNGRSKIYMPAQQTK